ncbi:MAG: hypothetical protein GX055_08245 [Desulfovibrionales bacterium]|nr:hypothetical protein [Desulfovibrionales bacterium]
MREVTVFLHSQRIERRSSLVREICTLQLRRGVQTLSRCAQSLARFWMYDRPVVSRRI